MYINPGVITAVLIAPLLLEVGSSPTSRIGAIGEAPRPRARTILRRQSDTCPVPKSIHVTAPKTSPFTQLSDDETSSIVEWLQSPELSLNLTAADSKNLTQTDNYIWLVEAILPNKTDVLTYFDGNGALPPRYARVVIHEGGKAIPDATEYLVGPLPVGSNTQITTLDYIYNGINGPHVPFNGRFPDRPRSQAIDTIVVKTMSSIADITADLTGLAYYGRNDPRTNATYFVQNPSSTNGSQALIWTPWRRTGLAPYDRPADLYVSFDISGTDPSLYHMRMILYNMVIYHSVEEFRAAWEKGEIAKSPPPTTETAWLKKDRQGPIRDLEDRLAPTILELDGKRYKTDSDNRYVEYLGWGFYTRFDRDVGIQFFDIKFKDERIMYELSLQDAIAQYAGNNPFQAGTAYNDRFYGIGAQTGRLIPGFDCPYHATYWNATYSNGEKTATNNNSICIFETDIGVPITRHTDSSYMQSTKGSKLVVRQIATVGNYDYLFDYGFLVDGTITVDVHASGYVQGNYYRPDDEGKWGPRIQETISGSLHTHVMNFKADFDLIDSKNTFVKTDIIVENITQPWYPERGTFEMMRYNISELQTEDEGLLPLPANGQSMYSVVNKDHKNKWGESRGYRIVPGLSNVHLASQHSPFFLKSAQYAKQAFAVSRQHDTEPCSSAALSQNIPEAPPVEFWKFFDGEDLVQQDIVAWVNLGMHHYTRSEDIPNTLMSEAHSSIMFAPQNWGDTELTVDLTNAIIYNAPEDGTEAELVVPNVNGVKVNDQCLVLLPQDELSGVFEGAASGAKLYEVFE